MVEHRISLNQDVLVAYVDRELPPEQAEVVEAALAHDEAARETVRLLRLSAEIAAQSYADVLNEPIPDRLLAAARGAKPMPAARPRRMARLSPWLIPLAAGLAALVIGFAGGNAWRSADESGYGPALAPSVDPLESAYEATLQGALESGQAGQAFSYESEGVGKGAIRLGREFTTGFGASCREFSRQETRGTASSTGNGIACRTAQGGWTVMVLPGAS